MQDLEKTAITIQDTLVPALEASKSMIDINGLSSSLKTLSSAVTAVVDTSWLKTESKWTISVSKLLSIDAREIETPALNSLLSLEQATSRIVNGIGIPKLTSIAAQIASISSTYSNISDRWKDLVMPYALLEDLQDLATKQYRSIQKETEAADWRLGLLDSASRYVDRQVSWTGDIIAELQDKIESMDEAVPEEQYSAVPLIPQYIGYTNRADRNISPEQGLEKSSIVEITEKGKKIIENAVIINNLCIAAGLNQIFKYTAKMMLVSSNIGTIFCNNKESFGTMIDDFYMMFYENLEHIKEIFSDAAVRKEDIYQCIFRVKDMRTDLRHDYEHGGNSKINQKRKNIAECYKHYTNKPVLYQQKDFVTLQKRLYDEFLLLEEHLIDAISKMLP